MKSKKLSRSMMLLLAALVWGVAFVAQSVGMEHMGPFTFNAARFILGGIVLLPFAVVNQYGNARYKKNDKERKEYLRISIIGGICCGIALTIGGNLQQCGILYTSVGKAGFLTALYIVLVPVFGIFMKQKPERRIWIGSILALLGLYLLCMHGSFAPNFGDVLLLLGAVAFTFHIIVIDHFSSKANCVMMSCVQFLVSGVTSLALAFIFEEPTFGAVVDGALPILYAGILSCGVGYTLQILGQKYVEPTVASLILSLESVISVLAGWVILHEVLSMRELFGCAFMFIAVILVQLPEKKNHEDNINNSR